MTQTKSVLAGTIITGALAFQGTPADAQSGASANAIVPFHISFPESALADLKQRILATRWPDRELVKDETQGVQFATMQKLAKYWATDYNWRKVEARLNAL